MVKLLNYTTVHILNKNRLLRALRPLQSINKTKCAADYGDLIRSQGDFKNKNLGESNLELETTAALPHKEIIDLRPEIFLPPRLSK